MERFRIAALGLIALGTTLAGCERPPERADGTPVYASTAFHNYWHAGKAEVNSYVLSQSRYGEQRPGKAVLIFVTEDLSKDAHVKLDNPEGRNKVNVLKLNFTKKFITGIYPYSLMLSVFTPVNREKEPASLKATMSSQEWCGQVYTQLNLRGNRYAVKSHSYFEQEGDQRFSVRQALLEDEIWNFIRLDHENLPLGKIEVIPGLFFSRLHHEEIDRVTAIASKTASDSAFTYKVTFPQEQRELSVTYERDFPFRILSWRESWLQKDERMQTTGTLDETLYIDYWTKNGKEFLYLRDSLNLPTPYGDENK